ncbi:hypothetical protein ANCDUO_09470 [Ancylostoma duodenale]|uniref:Uncharacterized protein n=1 Tax=Ancylostoma duodenale TaxID=51022 RepID=A0A0C2GMP3_9BILA|nr:hypothetical protein ANCDUO_09470 [Ancylostoma duodenale]
MSNANDRAFPDLSIPSITLCFFFFVIVNTFTVIVIADVDWHVGRLTYADIFDEAAGSGAEHA